MFRPRVLACLLAAFCAVTGGRAEEIPWNAGWRFQAGDPPGAAAAAWDDTAWRLLDLPHDWSIEGVTDPAAPSAGGGGFFPTGVVWYRNTFTAPADWAGRTLWFESDGAYRDSEVWFNGHSLGRRPNGFVPLRYELTPYLRPGAENVVAIRVDNSAQPNSRYYTGTGLTRPVRLRLSEAVHFVPDSVSLVTDQLTGSAADVTVRASVRNDTAAVAELTVAVALLDATGRPAADAVHRSAVAGGESLAVSLPLTVPQPRPWSPETPALYTLRTRLLAGTREVDRAETTVGLRTVRVSAARGFELNGRPLELFGTNVHDDNGPLGTAAFARAEERRAELIKAAGFNAVRTAHHPASPAFLAACDRLGLLVLAEAFDGWKSRKLPQDYGRDFDEWALRDLDAMILRDRNHPAIVLWDIGNEPYERGKPAGAAIARQLADRARELDPSRPVTAGINGLGQTGPWSGVDPVLAALDVAGYNYEIAHHAEDHARLPERVIVISESYHTETFANWAIVQAQPYVIGDFVWSGLDYLGEAGIGRVFPSDEPVRAHWQGSHYPWHGAACGDLDLTGARKPLSHYRSIVWDRGETLYATIREPTPDGRPWNLSLWAPPPLTSHWTWPGHEGRALTVEVYSRHAAVRLYLNDRLLGEQPTTVAQEFKAVFPVPYEPGTLRAVGVDAGRETETYTLVTAGPPARLRLTADRATLRADSQDLAFVTVEVTDAAGRVVPAAADAITYTLTGPATLAGIGSADLTSPESYRANPRRAHEGRALVVVRSPAVAGTTTLTATAAGLTPASLTLTFSSP